MNYRIMYLVMMFVSHRLLIVKFNTELQVHRAVSYRDGGTLNKRVRR